MGVRLVFPDLGQETDLWPTLCKCQDITVLEISFFDPFAIDKCPIGALVNQFELVSFSSDFGMIPGNQGKIGREAESTGGMAANRDNRVKKLLDFTLQRPQDMDELNNDHWWTFHLSTLAG